MNPYELMEVDPPSRLPKSPLCVLGPSHVSHSPMNPQLLTNTVLPPPKANPYTHNERICYQQQYLVQQTMTLVSQSPALLVVRSFGHWLFLLLLFQPSLQEPSTSSLGREWALLQELAGPLGHIRLCLLGCFGVFLFG